MSSNFMAAVTIGSGFGAQEEEICHYFHLCPFYLPWSNGAGCHDLSFFFLIFSLKLAHSLSFFTLKRLFSSSSLSAIRVVSSAYLRLLMFLLPILITACNSFSLAFLMYMYMHMYMASQVAPEGKESAPARETRVWFLDQEGPLEKGMATYSSILAWRTSWTEEPGGLQSVGSQRVGHDWMTNTHTCICVCVCVCVCVYIYIYICMYIHVW